MNTSFKRYSIAAEVFAKALVAVTRIDHHHVCALLVQLAHDRVHVEAYLYLLTR